MDSRLPRLQSDFMGQAQGPDHPVLLFALAAATLILVVAALFLGLSSFSALMASLSFFAALGALVGVRSFGRPAQTEAMPDSLDLELLGELVSMNRRATILTDVRGRRQAANASFNAMVEAENRGLGDLLGGERSFSQFNRLMHTIRRQGEGSGIFRTAIGQMAEVTLSGRRIGRYILWEVRGEGTEARLRRETSLLNTWLGPLLDALGCGAAVVDADGNMYGCNPVLRHWLGLDEDADFSDPRPLPLRGEDTYLEIRQGRRIDVDLLRVPLQAREEEREVGSVVLLRPSSMAPTQQVIRDGDGPEGPVKLIDAMLDAAPVAIALVDCAGTLVEFNRTLQRFIGKGQLKTSESLIEFIENDDRGTFLRALEDTCDGAPPLQPLDVRFVGDDHRTGQVHFSTLMGQEKGTAILYLADMTQEKQLEKQFVQAQKMQAVGQLAGGVAHDFNNLLTAIIGFCDLLLLRHDTGDKSFSDLIQIKQNANRAANLVRQLLAFSRQQVVQAQVLNITDVLAELSNLVRRLIGEHIEYSIIHGRGLPRLKADQGQLEQVLVNLCVNARDAMPDGGKLEIHTRSVAEDDPVFEEFDVMTPGKYVEIEVRDTGTGISEDVRSKIFEPFFTTKGVGEGTGLGLSTVYGIVKQTGGFVFCRSEVGAGTSFFLYFEAYDEEAADLAASLPAAEEQAKDLSGKGTIMLVEDEDSVRLFAERALASKGYKVIECASPDIALEELKLYGDELTLMITDVVMPEMDGPTLVDIVRKDYPDLPVIFVSGYAEDLLANRLDDPKNSFLGKPFSLKALAELAKTVMGE